MYVEAVTENPQTTRALAEMLGKPETTINIRVKIDNIASFEDEVRYTVANVGSFYYELLTHPELVSAYASDLIYNRQNKPAYALKIQDTGELEKLGLSSNIISLLLTDNTNDGFNGALYREYMTGKYVLTFAGTQGGSLADWANNIAQAFGEDAPQYDHAMAIGKALSSPSVTGLTASNTYITGHSLGGGLASAASMASGFHAYTFNAAGLHPETVKDYPTNCANAAALVTAYQVDFDILTWGQYDASWNLYLFGSNNIPQAVGTKVSIDSQYDWEVLVSLLFLGPLGASSMIIYCGYQCHLTPQVLYGMESRIFD